MSAKQQILAKIEESLDSILEQAGHNDSAVPVSFTYDVRVKCINDKNPSGFDIAAVNRDQTFSF